MALDEFNPVYHLGSNLGVPGPIQTGRGGTPPKQFLVTELPGDVEILRRGTPAPLEVWFGASSAAW